MASAAFPPGGDDAVFEIQDFSVATPLEAMIAEIEDALRVWLKGGTADGRATEPLTRCIGRSDRSRQK